MSAKTCSAILFACLTTIALAQEQQQPPAPGSAAELVEQGQKLLHAGKVDDALTLYQRALTMSPDLYEAHLAAGVALDLKGDYAQAQQHFSEAIDVAPADSRQQALRAMAVSGAFAGNAPKARESEVRVFKERMAKNDLVGAAEICNELARIELELGDTDRAYKWYQAGYETAMKKSDLTDPDKNLWLFRWESAQARVAARQGRTELARQHVVAAKAALDKANNPDQARFYPYLTGYVAFYTGDYKSAISDLQQADQHDPLILALLAEAYEKTGDAAQAKSYYQKVLEINIHNPTNAFARPLAQKKLSGMS